MAIDAVKTMVFDKDGFLWLGGEYLDIRTIMVSEKKLSLQRFNGRSFHTIPIPDTEPKLDKIEQLYRRDDGKFYVRGRNKLWLFNPYSLEFQPVLFEHAKEQSFSLSDVFRYQDNVYILSQLDRSISLNMIHENLRVETLFQFTSDENKFLMDKSTIFIGYEDFCVIGDDNFPITFLDWEGNIINRHSSKTFSRDRGSNQRKFIIDQYFEFNGNTYTMMREQPKLHRVNSDIHRVQPVSSDILFFPNISMKIAKDTLGNHLIVTTDEDRLRFHRLLDEQTKTEIYSAAIFDEPPKMEVLSHDLKDDLWIGTDQGELHYFKFPSDKIKTYLPNNSIRAIESLTDSTYLIATEENGWYRLEPRTQEIIHLDLTEGIEPLNPYSSRNLFIDEEKIWSNSGSSIVEVNLDKNDIESYRHYPVLCIVEPSDSTLIYGTNGYHLMEFNKRTKQHLPLISTDTLFNFDLELQKDFLLGATDKGVFTYNLTSKETRWYQGTTHMEDPFVLSADFHEKYGYLLGTRSGLIIGFDPPSETFTTLYKDDLKAGIATILFEGDTWWINTFNGIVAFDPRDGSKVRFSDKDGLSHNEANRYSALHTGDGLLVGTISGLNYFKPSDLKPPTSNSRLSLLKLRSFSAKDNAVIDILDRQRLAQMETVVLPAEYKELQLDFSLTDNVTGREHTFRYRMDDQDWVDLGEEQSIRFLNLAAGNYRLELEALDFSGNKMGESIFLNIDSRNFFYKTWWFYLVLALAIMLFLGYLLKQAQVKRRLQEQFSEDLMISQEEERTRIAKDLHDSVGQQLTLIKRKAQNLEQGEIAKVTYDALEEVRGISRGLYPANLKLLGLSESIEQLIYDLDEQTELFFSSEIEDVDAHFSEAATLNFYRFVQECLTNTLKHSDATSVSVKIKKQKDSIFTEISDNGKGFDATDKRNQNSLGLKTLAERIRILKGTIHMESKPGEGTTIRTETPVI
ncbi:MAG: ATP-binding protein [Bacteroidota bacterium]